MNLTKAMAGEHVVITALRGDAKFVGRATAIGLTVGCPIEILRNEKKQPMLIYGRDTMLALSRKECEKIEVMMEGLK